MNRKPARQQGRAPTIADVAAVAGFSPMTVSRVINGEANVRASTRQAVQAAVAKLNYAPNAAARSLAGAEQIRIGMLYSNPSAAYLSRFLLGGLEQARISHVQLVIERCDSDAQDEEQAVRDLLASDVDGIILSPPLCDSENILALLMASDALVVAVTNWRPPAAISVVRIDDHEAAAAMTRHMLALGHRRIGHIIGNPTHKASAQRLAGFRAAMADAGVPVDPSLIAQGQFTYRSGLSTAEQLLDVPERPTAIFAGNDDMAAAVVAVAHRRNLNVPSDLTVCGFDDTDFAQSIWPELTTIHQPIAEMSRTALKMLVHAIRSRRAGSVEPPSEAVLDYTLVRRDSDAPPSLR
ncbi:LacI family DNA-binding transcriptional regulator [Polymorphobacter fuscus]|uniref:LacI family DNA-binding transcriptional regulator n=1 Tax=Sandarakinorhabdus fusca TaxID=1439888 RepID=A0A7C9KWX1_9SPHN|nr:LacI family DNA-binding transcriptional regulator [Polymorphobacter fuscus]KAB7648825.1 LacI family transcriptional regulator [Polymorphobacter fuscus]MQT16406.1 LacI family DNA-binding transcriptional regulator [Polymorphobacter fuscus]NJC07305.1 LacI family transcriptional regulator [Polymorphobacter fuscus]